MNAAWGLNLPAGPPVRSPLLCCLRESRDTAYCSHIGFAGQKVLLERVRDWLPAEVVVVLLADRFYPLIDLPGRI